VNDTLDAVISPLSEAARCVDDLARGRIRHQGDFRRIVEGVNGTLDTGGVGARAQLADHRGDRAAHRRRDLRGPDRPRIEAVASGASEQAATLESTTGSLETVSGMVRQSTDHSQQANALAQAARAAAAEGAKAAEEMR